VYRKMEEIGKYEAVRSREMFKAVFLLSKRGIT
jgi:hypothetical protein